MTALKQLIQKLRLDIKLDKGGLFYLENNAWKNELPYRLHKGLEEICPDAFFVQNGKLLILFFDFIKERRGDEKELFKKIWNIGGAPIVFIIKSGDTEIYNGFSFDTKKNFTFEDLKIKGRKVTEGDISFWDIFSGKFWQQLPEPKNLVDEKLLRNIQDTQKALEKDGLESIYANNIIGRLLFSRYLIDRKVKIAKKYFKDEESFLKILKEKNKKLLYQYFEYLKIKFNGDLFPISDGEKEQIKNKHLKILFDLFCGNEIESGQQSLFKTYDFKIIPVELISEVYERFIGEEKQRKEGAYYTPSFLVDYILEKTVKEHLKKNKSCKILDPSCGSGIFLVETLRCIIEKNLQKSRKISRKKLEKLINDNIFGVDKNESAINLSVFSLCLTLLDYIEPKDITKFRFPELKNKNLFKADFFNTEHKFNEKIKKIDYILGNPPWGSDKEKDNHHIRYFKKEEIPVSDKQIAQSFAARIKDFSSQKTRCVLILTSKILYNHNAKKFRAYWLKNFFVDKVLELSPVRSQLFTKATAPSAIVFYQYAHKKETKNNIITHTSIKPNIFLKYLKILVIEKNDIKEIKQEYFQKHDWLWKVMLYGNTFDFYFIKRLKDSYKTLNEIIKDHGLTFGQGFIKGKNGKYNSKHLKGKIYIDTRKSVFSKFFINENILDKYKDDTPLYRQGKKNIFQAPYVLLKEGFNKKDFSLVTAYSEKDFVFRSSITAIKGEDKYILKSITGVLNSVFSNYLLLLQGSYAGIEREKALNEEERFEFPMLYDKKISKKVDEIQEAYEQLNKEHFNNQELKISIKKAEDQLNVAVLNLFEVSSFEQRLIDYATEISIPLLNNNEAPIKKATEKQLKNYAQIFLDHFGSCWDGNLDFFEIDIYFNNYIAGMNFKVVSKKRKELIEFKKLEDRENLFELMKLGKEKITNNFYQQRDIKGFNKTSFYIVKPNQYKNWHQAVAQTDLHEFVEMMMNAEMKSLIANK